MSQRFGIGLLKLPSRIGTPITIECMDKCLAEMGHLSVAEQLFIVETLGARLAWKMGRKSSKIVLDGIRKHAGQVVDGFLKKLGV